MKLRNRSGTFTFDEFCLRVQDGQKADLIDGVIYMASPDNTDAGDLFVWLIRILGDFCDDRDLGKVFGSRIAFKLDNRNTPEPDIAVVLKEHLDRVERGHVDGAADLALEIVFPSSAERDYDTKRYLRKVRVPRVLDHRRGTGKGHALAPWAEGLP